MIYITITIGEWCNPVTLEKGEVFNYHITKVPTLVEQYEEEKRIFLLNIKPLLKKWKE